MPRPRDQDPSAGAVRQREARAREKAADPEGFAKKTAEASKAYRDRKKAERAAAAGPPPETGGPLARKALAECREKVCDEVADKLGAFYSAAIKKAEEASAAAPALKAAAVESAAQALVKLSQAISVESLADRLVQHSKENDQVPIERKTATDYATHLLFLQKLHTGKPAKEIDFEVFRDVEGVWQTILGGTAASGPNKGKPWALASKVVYAGAISGTLRRLAGFENERAEYFRLYSKLLAEKDVLLKQNRLSADEEAKFVPWPQLVTRFEKEARGPTQLSSRDLALFGLYVAIPPRRVMDYQLMRLAGPGTKLDEAANWLVLDRGGKPSRLVINRYKTSKRYGQFVRDSLPPALQKVLGSYVREAELEAGELIFPTTGGEVYTPAAFSALVGALFQRLFGHRAGVNALRHSAVTHFLAKKKTVAQREAFAKEMAHSVGMQALYEKIESSDDEAPAAKPAAKAPAAKAPAAKAKAGARR